MNTVYNFSAGPSMLPPSVMRQVQSELLDWQSSGMSVMEISHRSKAFLQVAEKSEQDFRDLLEVPDEYKILFVQGGASLQFSMLPLNLLGNNSKADYVETGAWSSKAIEEAGRFCQVNVVASDRENRFTTIPDIKTWNLDPAAAYLHYTPNETIHGVEFNWVPETGDVPLVADMSSNILSQPIDVSKFGVIYAGAQKNIGPAGLALVIIREDLLGRCNDKAPALFDYQSLVEQQSMLNTPPTFAWYVAGLVFEWLKGQGGLAAIAEKNARKSQKLYAAIDASDFYFNPVDLACRSRMNVPFILNDENLNALFLEKAENAGLMFLKGHRSVGGMRASLYNAMPEAGVQALIEFMQDFESRYG